MYLLPSQRIPQEVPSGCFSRPPQHAGVDECPARALECGGQARALGRGRRAPRGLVRQPVGQYRAVRSHQPRRLVLLSRLQNYAPNTNGAGINFVCFFESWLKYRGQKSFIKAHEAVEQFSYGVFVRRNVYK